MHRGHAGADEAQAHLGRPLRHRQRQAEVHLIPRQGDGAEFADAAEGEGAGGGEGEFVDAGDRLAVGAAEDGGAPADGGGARGRGGREGERQCSLVTAHVTRHQIISFPACARPRPRSRVSTRAS